MFQKLKNALARLHRDETGAMKVEMILILVLISLPLLIALYLFRDKILGYFQDQSNKLDQNYGSGDPPYNPG